MSAVFALLSSLLWGTSDFLGGTASRRLPTLVVIGAGQALSLLGLIPLAAFTGGFAASTGYLGWAIGAGVVGLVGLTAFYRALASGTMGVVAPIAGLGVVVPVGVGLARGESPDVWQLLGIAVGIVGVVLAGGPELSGEAGARPLALAAAAAIGFGLVFVFIAEGGAVSVVMTLLCMRATTVVILLIGLLIVRPPRTGVRWRDTPTFAVIGGFDAGANGLYSLATRTGLLSVVAVLSSLYPAVTTLLARQLHGERLRPVQIAGVGAVLVGVLLLAAG